MHSKKKKRKTHTTSHNYTFLFNNSYEDRMEANQGDIELTCMQFEYSIWLN